ADADGASRRVRMTQATARECSQPSLTLTTARTSRRRTTSTCRCSARTSARRRPSRPRYCGLRACEMREIAWGKLTTDPAFLGEEAGKTEPLVRQ
ncbi:hypothetical protein PFISCL1PPCAC_26282, partial [Pristionchus fissidentatus]